MLMGKSKVCSKSIAPATGIDPVADAFRLWRNCLWQAYLNSEEDPMTATVIDGKAFAATVREKVGTHVSRLKDEHGITPGLAVVLVGEDPASQVYVVINSIDPAKDVDGFHISNVGLLGTGQKSMVPCTPLGCLMMLRDHHGSLSGLNAVVIGRSNIVGKPMANLLLGDSCTVTIRANGLPEPDGLTA